jgi:hypothetical protein
LREIAKINSPGALGYHLTDGDINLAMLKFKNHQTAGAPIRDDINDVLGLGKGLPAHINAEAKYGAADGVIIDVSETGWAGTARHPR